MLSVQFETSASEDAVRRLRRVEGQIGGIIRMLESGRECREVFQQVAAATKALERAGFKLLAVQLRECLRDEAAAEQDGYSAAEIEKLFLSLR